jgi:hypothetical protein
MTTLSNYSNIEVGDTITLPTSMNLVKSGVIIKIRKWNGNAMRVICSNGAIFELNKHNRDFILTREENN